MGGNNSRGGYDSDSMSKIGNTCYEEGECEFIKLVPIRPYEDYAESPSTSKMKSTITSPSKTKPYDKPTKSVSDWNTPMAAPRVLFTVQPRTPLSYIPLHYLPCMNTDRDVARMEGLLELNPETLERLQPSYYRPYDKFDRVLPLHDACQRGHMLCMEFLVDSDADVNKTDLTIYHHNSIQYAYFHRGPTAIRMDMMLFLLLRGASLNNTYYDNYLIPSETLISAVENHHNDVVYFLLENGSVTDKKRITETGEQIYEPSNIYTPVFAALSVGNMIGYRLLLEHGASHRVFIADTLDLSLEYAIPHLIVNRSHNTEIALEAMKIYRDYDGNLLAENSLIFDHSVTVPDVPQMGHLRIRYDDLVNSDVIEFGSVLDLLSGSPVLRAHLPGLLEELEMMIDEPEPDEP